MKMTRLLYIGNKLMAHGNTATTIETLGPLLEAEGFSIRYSSSKKNKVLRLLDMFVSALRFASASDYVLIDTYSTSNFWYAFVTSQVCRVLGAKYIPILAGGDLPNRLRRNPVCSRMIFAHSHRNVAPSGYLMDAFSKAGFSRLVYIPNTITLNDYDYLKRDAVRPKLLWVRSFSPIYNPKMAIDVLVRLKQQFPDASLCMVGPDKNGFMAEVTAYDAEHQANAKFTGRLSRREWCALSKDCDIFINTTHFDNTPVSVIEAMALGLPVVSTNVGGIPFLLEHGKTALLVEDSDTDAMVNAIEELIADPNKTSRITAAAYETVRRFDWSQTKHSWFEILA